MIITDTPLDTFDMVFLDTLGILPTTTDVYRHILTMQDYLSKYCIAVAIPNLSASTIAQALAMNLFAVYGAPRCILTDRGSSFISKLLRHLSKILNLNQVTIAGYRPQINGALERRNTSLVEYIKMYANNCDDWDRLLPYAMFAYNTSVHEATKFTPYEIIFGRVARTPSTFPDERKLETYGSYLRELITRLHEIRNQVAKNQIGAKMKSKKYYDRKAKPLNAQVGDFVRVKKEIRHGKLDKYYRDDVYKVIGFSDGNNVRLEANDGTNFSKHADKLKLTHS